MYLRFSSKGTLYLDVDSVPDKSWKLHIHIDSRKYPKLPVSTIREYVTEQFNEYLDYLEEACIRGCRTYTLEKLVVEDYNMVLAKYQGEVYIRMAETVRYLTGNRRKQIPHTPDTFYLESTWTPSCRYKGTLFGGVTAIKHIAEKQKDVLVSDARVHTLCNLLKVKAGLDKIELAFDELQKGVEKMPVDIRTTLESQIEELKTKVQNLNEAVREPG